MDANERKALRERAEAPWPSEGDAFERAVAYRGDVLALLDALEAAERERDEAVSREEAMTVVGRELQGHIRALTGDLAKSTRERDELAAEVAAYQGRPEGALEGWAYDYGWTCEWSCLARYRASIEQHSEGWSWKLLNYGVAEACSECGHSRSSPTEKIESSAFEPTPRAAMRAAMSAARERGWRPPGAEAAARARGLL